MSTLTPWHAHSFAFCITLACALYRYDYFNISTNRSVPYPMNTSAPGAEWLRDNPHRLDLIQVGLRRRSKTTVPLQPIDVHNGDGATQRLDPWTGELQSNFSFGLFKQPVRYVSCGCSRTFSHHQPRQKIVPKAYVQSIRCHVTAIVHGYGQ